MTTKAEENYLKAIFKVVERERKSASTNAIAREIQTSAASVTDMIKRLADKELVNYEKYRGVTLTDLGRSLATDLVRRHRLWETFLVDKLGFKWNEVHDLAEELEHIDSNELVRRLDTFLNHPRFDPHGDPIPSEEGKFTLRSQLPLNSLQPGETGEVVGVREHGDAFLKHLEDLGIVLGNRVRVDEINDFDGLLKVAIGEHRHTISEKVAGNVYVKRTHNDG